MKRRLHFARLGSLGLVAGASVAAALGAVALAQGGLTLHEFVPDVGSDEGSLLVSSGGAQPDAIVYRGEVLPAPTASGLGADERPMRADPGDGREREEAGRRSQTFRPDRVTDLNQTVGYYTVFTPTIAPHKRVTALDAVTLADDGTPVLSIADRDRVVVPVLGAHAEPPDERPRDRFWGSVVLDFSEGPTVPLPSVSPESRVLTMQTDPPTELRVEKDPADNFYAVAVGSAANAVRAIFLMDAPRTYFGQPLGEGRADARALSVTPLPGSVERDAREHAAELGLSRASPFDEALATLAAEFRSFEESSQYPRDTGNIYLDLVRSRRGICRHRAYGFVITAHALGIHARFVQNEAHAWVEVERPAGGWLRVDLGGAAVGLEARGAEDRPSYRPEVRDPLPRPLEYEEALREAQRMNGLRPPDAPMSAGGGGAAGGGAGGATAGAAPPATADRPGAALGYLTLHLDREQFEVFRGRELELTGAARGAGAGVEGLRVEALLRAARGDAEWLLGVTVTNEAGRFRGVFGVPPELPVGDYGLLVRTPGNESWAPATAR